MHPEHPVSADIPALRRLWQQAFGDTEEYLDGFFRLAFSPQRCLCIRRDEGITAALYWLDMHCQGRRAAYIYAVATGADHRGQGLCRSLMGAAHEVLREQGYALAVLVPEDGGLARMYERMGYAQCCRGEAWQVEAATAPIHLRAIGPGEFRQRRAQLLPPKGLALGREALDFLAIHAEFFAGEGVLLTAVREAGVLQGLELLGDREAAPALVAALGCSVGRFSTPDAWCCPLAADAPRPEYLGFAFD